METMEIAGVYVIMVAAILAGLLLLWFMLLELLRFDSGVNRPRSAQVPAPLAPVKPSDSRLPAASRARRQGASWRPVRTAPR
jgi:hypothetical protein